MQFKAARTMCSAPVKKTGRWIHAFSRPVLLPEDTNYGSTSLGQQETRPGG